jgi:hypothetical protein
MAKRLWQYTEATALEDDDYILIDNPEGDSKSILASKVGAVMMNKTITERGTYKASDDGVNGYSQVVVDVPYTDVHVATGDIATFEGEDLPLKSLTVDIEPQQDLHGYDYPWAGGSGKNKLKVNSQSSTSTGITATVNSDGSITINGTSTGTYIYTINNTLILNGDYILSGCPSGGSAGTYRMDCYWDGQGALKDTGNGVAISPNGNAVIVRIVVMQGVTVNNLVFKPMIRLASVSDATFEPYSNICPISGFTEANVVVSPTTDAEYGQIYNTQFKDGDNPLTVYGGTLDVVSGELVVDRVTYNVTSILRNNASSYYHMISSSEVPKIDNFETVISDKLPTAINSVSVGIFINHNAAIRINTPNEYASASDMLTAYGGSIQVVYELAEPITYQLTPTQVKSLLGANNVWADCGPVDVEYQTEWVRPAN